MAIYDDGVGEVHTWTIFLCNYWNKDPQYDSTYLDPTRTEALKHSSTPYIGSIPLNTNDAMM